MEKILKRLESSDLKLIEKETGIPYDRMYKWRKGKSRPKAEDLLTLMNYFNGSSSIEPEEETTNEYGPEALISELRDRLKEKDDRLADKDKIIARTEESMELWKEKALGYEKKISTDVPGMGTAKRSHPQTGREKR